MTAPGRGADPASEEARQQACPSHGSPPPPGPSHGSPPPPRPHILVVNGRKVRQPVFVVGSPWSGTEALARALKRTEGFHLTLGQRAVLAVVHGLARKPSISQGRPEAAATALRDAFAQGWLVTPDGCLGCSRQCQEAGRTRGAAPCVRAHGIVRYGDASPDLLSSAGTLAEAFPDALLIQLIRDGRDVVAGMLADSACLAWFKPGFVDVDAEFPHPLLGIETEADRAAWRRLSLAGKSALRWRGTVRQMARLRGALPARRLVTLRYEELIRRPAAAAATVSDFVGHHVGPFDAASPAPGRLAEIGVWRRALTGEQAAEVAAVAGEELRRVGYGV